MPNQIVPIKTALFSVTDKDGIEELAKGLLKQNCELTLLASGGTGNCLTTAGFDVTEISDYTETEESFDGRVKTLHPKIAGGLLFKRGKHEKEAKQRSIPAIDLLVCNLYDFKKKAQENSELEELVEEIDIGGVTLIRAAAKNHEAVTVVVDPADYPLLLKELDQFGGITLLTRRHLAAKALNATADYDAMIAETLTRKLTGEETKRVKLSRGKQLRYGENPDQEGWLYHLGQGGIADAEVLGGKALSYNNIEDATAAYRAAQELCAITDLPGVAIIKHGNLCGYAAAPTLQRAFELAWEGDPKSAFGSVVACTKAVSEGLTEQLRGKFIELLIAPDFEERAEVWLHEKKPNARLLKVGFHRREELLYRTVSGGLLVQSSKKEKPTSPWSYVTQKERSGEESLLRFAVAAVSNAKSNAVALVRELEPRTLQLLAIGAGQPNRVDSLEKLAIPRALENLEREGKTEEALSSCVLASDGFFPFADSIEAAAHYGIGCCVQPGGSKRDKEVIAAADRAEMSMVFTGERYFTH